MSAITVAGRGGGHQPISAADMVRLRDRLQGDLLLAHDPGYDAARKVWNGMVDKRPAAIAYCASADDVISAVDFARARDLLVSVRAGGHNAAGNCVCDGGLVIDLSRLKGIVVDSERRRARAQAGLNLGEFDAATQAHGLATTMGVNSDTGMAGLTLGGGIGRLGRKYGLACDNVIAADVVTADGRLLTASATENADLFWAIRGGGGNFGIVTSFDYALHPVGPTVLGGSLLFSGAQVRDAMRFFAEFSSNAPDELCTDAALVTGPDGGTAFSIAVFYAGPIEQGLEAVKPLRDFGTPSADAIGPVAYTTMQAAADPLFARGRRFYWKALLLNQLSDAVIDRLLQGFARVPSALSITVLQQVGGAIARVPSDATAYAHRRAGYDCFPISIWEDPAADERNVRWARETWDSIMPLATGAVYVNNLGDEGGDRVKAAYGANYPRLQAVKSRYDPDNFFSGNQNVKPKTG